ncbi:MAG TPA: hypothetical protein VHF25_11020 [Nitriliruptorales bacterium]|nr:hypothetical protein [Nitriliruptorales bacterium]
MRAVSTPTSRRPPKPKPTRRLDVGIVLIALMVALFVGQLVWVVSTTRMDTPATSSSAEQRTGGST